MQLDEMLRRMGLPKHSGRVFLYLETKIGRSARDTEKALRLHRPALYRALNALTSHSFVIRKKVGKRHVYIAQDRARILTTFTKATNTLRVFSTERPPSNLHNSTGTLSYFEGDDSVTAVFSDVVAHCKRGDVFYRYTSEKNLGEVNALLPRDYRRRRDAKRLERLVISNPESGSLKRPRLERFIKYLGKGSEPFHQNAIQLIYGSRIAFIDLYKREAFIIENHTLAEFQKTIFQALYKKL